MSEWITDRLPTKEDGNTNGFVLSSENPLGVFYYEHVTLGTPWQPYPEPYVKQNTWTWAIVRDLIEVYKNGKLLRSFGRHEISETQAEGMVNALNKLEAGI